MMDALSNCRPIRGAAIRRTTQRNRLTRDAAPAKYPAAMHKSLLLLAAPLGLVLAACSSEPETVTFQRYDPQAEALANAAPVELPPSIRATRTYRCRDNSLVYADFFTNDTVRVRLQERTAEPTVLSAEGGEPPYVAEGFSLSGDGQQVTFASPGRSAQTCSAAA